MKINHTISTYILGVLIVFAIGFGVCFVKMVKPLRVENDGVKTELQHLNQKADELLKK